MLPLVGKEMIDTVLRRFHSALSACQGLKRVVTPLGVSMKNGKICIVSALYDGSVGGKMAYLPGNKLPFSDALRFSTDIAKGVIELHSHGIVSLNLKPYNFLLNSRDEAVVGDYGIPLLFSSSCEHVGLKFWLGTPNYMAPEQWNVGARGPISFETDSWGFGCCIVEMISGRKPWERHSPQEIYSMVVLKGKKPSIPPGLPVAILRILEACFEYDYRNRPDFYDILTALTCPNSYVKKGNWVQVSAHDQSTRRGIVKLAGASSVLVQFSKKENQLLRRDSRGLRLWKDPLQVGDHVRVKHTLHISEGMIEKIDREEVVIRVKFCGFQDVWEGHPDELELVSLGIAAGDWVQTFALDEAAHHHLDDYAASCVGIVHRIKRNGDVQVAFVGKETLWTGSASRLAKINPFKVGETVKLQSRPVGRSLRCPRFEWPCSQALGRICKIMPNGCLLVCHQGKPWRKKRWWCDPAEVELVPSSSNAVSLLLLESKAKEPKKRGREEEEDISNNNKRRKVLQEGATDHRHATQALDSFETAISARNTLAVEAIQKDILPELPLEILLIIFAKVSDVGPISQCSKYWLRWAIDIGFSINARRKLSDRTAVFYLVNTTGDSITRNPEDLVIPFLNRSKSMRKELLEINIPSRYLTRNEFAMVLAPGPNWGVGPRILARGLKCTRYRDVLETLKHIEEVIGLNLCFIRYRPLASLPKVDYDTCIEEDTRMYTKYGYNIDELFARQRKATSGGGGGQETGW